MPRGELLHLGKPTPAPLSVTVMQTIAPADPDSAAEIRRCHRCGQATLVCLNAWRHSGGSETEPVTRDFRCQACGAVVVLHSRLSIAVMRVMGFIFLVALVPGICLLLLARAHSRAWRVNPVVPGAPRPTLRYQLGPRGRRCGLCGDVCGLVAVTRRRANGIPAGTEYKYTCRGCRQSFSTQDLLGVTLHIAAGLLCLGVAYTLWTRTASTTAWRLGGGGVAALCGIALFGQAVAWVVAAARNPQG